MKTNYFWFTDYRARWYFNDDWTYLNTSVYFEREDISKMGISQKVGYHFENEDVATINLFDDNNIQSIFCMDYIYIHWK